MTTIPQNIDETNSPHYSYQKDLIRVCYQNLMDNKKTVLAASCGAGKTRMSVEIIKKFIHDFPNKRVLILTHGQSLLRTQYGGLTAKTYLRVQGVY